MDSRLRGNDRRNGGNDTKVDEIATPNCVRFTMTYEYDGFGMERLEMRKIHLPIIIEIDEDGYYIVTCPLFKGCHSYGETIDKALEYEIAAKKIDSRFRGNDIKKAGRTTEGKTPPPP